MVLSKYILGALGLVLFVLGALQAFDWTSIVSAQTAGTIIGVIGALKMVLAALMPASGAAVKSTGGSIVTHEAA